MKETTAIIVAIVGAIFILAIVTIVCTTWLSVSKGHDKANEKIILAIVQSNQDYTIKTDGISAERLHGKCKITYNDTKNFTILNIFRAIYDCLSKHLSHSGDE